MSLLEVRGLTMRFGGLTAVSEVSFAVEPGQIYSVIGPNGAGKTTVFNAITGIYEPTEGEVRFEGQPTHEPLTPRTWLGTAGVALLSGLGALLTIQVEPLWQAAVTANFVYLQPFPYLEAIADFFRFAFGTLPWTKSVLPVLGGAALGGAGAWVVWQRGRRTPTVISRLGIARTFQNIRLFPEMTVLDNVLVGQHANLRTHLGHIALRLPPYWRERERSEAKARELLHFVDLGDDGDRLARNLPYGHQRRLEIARALASDPRLLLLDEPAAGMNPSETVELMALIRKVRDRGVTVVLIEHHMRVVMGISDRIAVLDYGNKIAEGTPAEIRANPRVIEAYLGKEDLG